MTHASGEHQAIRRKPERSERVTVAIMSTGHAMTKPNVAAESAAADKTALSDKESNELYVATDRVPHKDPTEAWAGKVQTAT